MACLSFQETRRKRRKTEILVEIATSGEKLEEAINKHAHEIDQEMVDILDERTKAAKRCQIVNA